MSDKNVTTGVYSVRYQFTREELRELGLRLAAKAQDIYNAKAARKAAAAASKALEEQYEAEASKMVHALNERSEIRAMECHIHYNVPRSGVKTIVRPDIWEPVFEQAMTTAEMQASFVFDDSPATPTAEGAPAAEAAVEAPEKKKKGGDVQ